MRRSMQAMSDKGRNMNQKSTDFNLSLEPDLDEFDPLEDLEPEDDAENGQSGEFEAAVARADDAPAEPDAAAPATDQRTADERTADLLKAMAPRRTVLLGILSSCAEPQPVANVNALVDRLQENNFSVYTAANLCSLLEKAGALERVTADGTPADDVEAEPQVVVVDGVEYLEAAEPAEVFWVATDTGTAAVEADKPLDRLRELFEDDAVYRPIYKRVLTLCATEGGANTKALGEAVDKDPLVQKPRFYAARFIDRLEKCDALAWQKTWVTTEIGKAGLDMLADVADDGQTEDATTASEGE